MYREVILKHLAAGYFRIPLLLQGRANFAHLPIF